LPREVGTWWVTQVFDVEMEKKYQCAKAMLADVYMAFKKSKKEAFSIIIFVP
jgi:hypothetical protein